MAQIEEYAIPEIDLVIVDLYPFVDTVSSGAEESAIIEKIDIGGISLIRAAAKNFKDVTIVASKMQYQPLKELLDKQGAATTIDQRKWFAKEAFSVSSAYDSAIFNWFDQDDASALRLTADDAKVLRYGENPHQKGIYYGDFNQLFDQLNGKEISYNNLLDIDAAVSLIAEFDELTFAILKHNNACGLASRETMVEAYKAAFEGDTLSAFGGVLVTNRAIDAAAAQEMNSLFFEIIIAPAYSEEALEILKSKKNRIILVQKTAVASKMQYRTLLNGVLAQDRDLHQEKAEELELMTQAAASDAQIADLLFANKIVKHSKSNAIVLAKDKTMCASGVGQTSRVDALKHAIEKAKTFGFDLQDAVMASDAFFPFPDCVEIAFEAGVTAVIQPGGSINDKLSVAYCDEHAIAMLKTGIRHFKH